MVQAAGAEKTIGAKELKRLCTTRKGADERAAEERGAWGGAFKAAQEKHGVDPIAFGMAYRLWKMADSARASRVLRNFMQYVDLLEIGGQADLEDAVNQAKGATEKPEDGDGDGADVVEDVIGGAALATFRDAIAGTDDVESVNRGLERFLADNPDHAEEAQAIAAARIEELNAEAGGGEDLRPGALRNKAKRAAEQTAAEAKGYSNRQNAIRAGRRVGKIENPVVWEGPDGQWFYRAPGPGDAPASEGAASAAVH